MDASGFTVRFRPAELREQLFNGLIAHAENLDQIQRFCGFGEQEVLGHDISSNLMPTHRIWGFIITISSAISS
ncbi:MAG: hypothetical protein R3C51_01385 [Parvularculaceae bacterium]